MGAGGPGTHDEAGVLQHASQVVERPCPCVRMQILDRLATASRCHDSPVLRIVSHEMEVEGDEPTVRLAIGARCPHRTTGRQPRGHRQSLTGHASSKAGQSGIASTRVKDLVDLALIASTSQVDADRLNRALRETYEQRGRHEAPGVLPRPPADWRVPYARMALEVGLERRGVIGRTRGADSQSSPTANRRRLSPPCSWSTARRQRQEGLLDRDAPPTALWLPQIMSATGIRRTGVPRDPCARERAAA